MRDPLSGVRTLGLWGFGDEGRAALRFAAHAGIGETLLFEDDGYGAVAPCGVSRVSAARELRQADLVIRSPGVTVHSSDMAELRRLVPVTTMTDLWMQQFGSQTVAITGTKGKSTTTALLSTLLNATGVATRPGGNIGSPLIPNRWFLGDAQFVVAEVSSYQAADLNSGPAHTVLTSFHADHLDWHGSVAQYRTDKLRLCDLSRGPTVARDQWGAIDALRGERLPFRRVELQRTGETLLDGRMAIADLTDTYLASDVGISAALLALEAARIVGVDLAAERDVLEASLRSFRGLPHRRQTVWRCHNLTAVDDTLATTPEAVTTTLGAFDARHPVALIAGGKDRGLDLQPLIDAVVARPGPTLVICMPDSGLQLAEAVNAKLRMCVIVEDIEAAVGEAFRWAMRIDCSSTIMLLSPASPSYNKYQNHLELSARFLAACKALNGPTTSSHSSE